MAHFRDPVRFGTPSQSEKRQVVSIGRDHQSACESLRLRRRYLEQGRMVINLKTAKSLGLRSHSRLTPVPTR
jgi:hypothetical protein